jgi:hypothetical protein
MSSLRLLLQSQSQRARVRNYDEEEDYDEEGIVSTTRTGSRWRVLLSFGGLLLMVGLGVWGVREVLEPKE